MEQHIAFIFHYQPGCSENQIIHKISVATSKYSEKCCPGLQAHNLRLWMMKIYRVNTYQHLCKILKFRSRENLEIVLVCASCKGEHLRIDYLVLF